LSGDITSQSRPPITAVHSLEKGGPQVDTAGGRGLLAAEHTLLMNLILIGVSFAAGWLLPRRAREMP
jgi:hypothetical protein